MWKASLRSVIAHRLRLALSGLAVVLGIAFVAGSLVFTDTISAAFDKLFDEISADVTVSKETAFDAAVPGQEMGATTVPADLVEAIAEVPGVARADGEITVEGIRVVDADGDLVGSGGGAPGLGIDYDGDDRSVTLVEGREPQTDDEIVVDSVSAERGDLTIGDQVSVLTPGPRLEAELVGVFRFGETGNLGGASLTGFSPDRAHELLGSEDFTEIAVTADDGHSLTELRAAISDVLPDGYVAKTRTEQAATDAADIKEALSFLNIFLLIFAGVAIVVGAFIILNTFTMLVAQRTRELALLRALGASRRQVTRSVLVEAMVVGVVGSALGIAAGVGLAAGLRSVFSAIGLEFGSQGLVLSPTTVLAAFAVGVPITVVAAYVPARRAARIPPVAAMRDDIAMPERSLRIRAGVGSVLTLAGAGLLAAGLVGGGSQAAVTVGLGVLGVFVGVAVISPLLSRPFVRALGAPFPALFGTVGRLGRENAVRNPRRTAATASALMIGLALIATFGVMAASINASIGATVDRSLNAAFVVSPDSWSPFSPEVLDEAESVDGVASVTRMRAFAAQIDGDSRSIAAVSAGSLGDSFDLDFAAGDADALGEQALLVDADVAASRGWERGDRVDARFVDGTELELQIAGIYQPNEMLGGYVVSLETAEAGGVRPVDFYGFVNLTDDADREQVRAALAGALDGHPEVTLQDQQEYTDALRAQADQLLYMIYGMLALAVVIAVLGIVNTLALSVTERTREIGLLRAVGMSRRQLRRMVRLESVVISVFGAVLGLAIGLCFGLALQRALADEGISELGVPVGQLVIFVVVAGLVGVLAAVWPARRAARLDVLRAITTE